MRLRKKMMKIASTEVKLKQSLISKVSAAVDKYCTKGEDSYYESIPLQDIFDTLKEFNIIPVQEDGTNWDGFLAGRDSKTSFDVVLEENGERKPVENARLHLTWYKFDDYTDQDGKWKKGRYEIVAYFA
jgi:hypothetical protein